MIVSKVLDDKGDLRSGFQLSEQSAKSSVTYIGKELVIQRRSAHLYHSWKARMEALSLIDDPDGLLLASRCRFESDEERGCFWVEYERCDLEGSPSRILYRDIGDDEAIELFQVTLNDVLATEALLRGSDLAREVLLPLVKEESSRVHLVQLMSNETIRDTFARLGFQIKAPLPTSSEVVLSHADVIPKNIILTSAGYRLIDWERLGLYPAETALSHALSWTLLKLPVDKWNGFLDDYLERCLEQMMMNETEARLSIYWFMLREVLYWTHTEDSFRKRLKNARELLP